MAEECIAFLFLECTKAAGALAVRLHMMLPEVRVEQLEHRELELGDVGILHEICFTGRAQAFLKLRCGDERLRGLAGGELGHSLDIDVQHIEE